MKNIFLINGYGVPKDIRTDYHYKAFLNATFNGIYDACAKYHDDFPIIILSGGKTDCFKPYRRTEAKEMEKIFMPLTRRSFVKQRTKKWIFLLERRAISTLENLLHTRAILQKKKIRRARVTIFCECTRATRVRKLARRVFGSGFMVIVQGIDFDVSSNRYLPADFLEKKEQVEITHSYWALRNPENLKKHHQLFMEKLRYLRSAQHENRPQAVANWWQKKLKDYQHTKGVTSGIALDNERATI